MNEKKPLWRIPVMWLVIGLPLASIVAGVGLVIIAVNAGGADPVNDEVRRVSQVQTTDLEPDAAARKRGLSAVLRVEDGVVEVLPATGEFARNAPLRIVLGHPIKAAEDVRLDLPVTTTGWRIEAEVDPEHDWTVELLPADGSWRLHGRLPKQQHATRLAPSLGGRE